MLPRSKVWTPDSTKQYLLWYQFLFGKKFVFDIISTLMLLPFPPLISFTSTTCLTSSTTQVKSYYLQGVPKMSLSEFVVIAAWAACFWCFSFYDKYSNSNLTKNVIWELYCTDAWLWTSFLFSVKQRIQWFLILFKELRAILWKFIVSTAVHTPLFSRMIHKLKLS